MKPKKINVETIHEFIDRVKKFESNPQNLCMLTYCKLEDRLYFRLDGPVVDGQCFSYYYSTGDRKGFDISPERYMKIVNEYLGKHGLNVVERKIPYHSGIETKKELSHPDTKSLMEIFIETFNDKDRKV